MNGVPDLLPMTFLLVTALALLYILQCTHHQIIAEASVPRFRPSGSKDTYSRRNNNLLLQIERKSFLWRASLNRCGVASSFEQSVFEVRGNEISLPNKDEVTKMARQLFSSYPEFLGRPSLTLGLCRAVQSSKNCSLQTSLFPLDVLTFGTPKVVSSKPHYRNIQEEKARDSSIGLGEVLCCIEIPIVGGLLANLDPSPSSKSITKQEHDHGCLRFTWLSIKNHRQQPKIVLVTEIAGNYRPSLAGNKIPIPAWRNIVYCSTQRMFHAYVMWRFHLFVAKEYRGKILMDSHKYDK